MIIERNVGWQSIWSKYEKHITMPHIMSFSDLTMSPSGNYFWLKEIATHSSIIAWKIPWTEEPGRLESMGSQRVRHDWTTSISLSHIFLVTGLAFSEESRQAMKGNLNMVTQVFWGKIYHFLSLVNT